MIRTLDDVTGKEIERNTFWLLGMKDDFYTIQQIKQSACEDSSVPVVVFYMAPRTGLVLDEQASHYMPPDRLPTWEEYDAKIEEYGEALADVPLMLILEPSFLMHTFNSENEYHAADHQLSFTQRVDSIIRRFPKGNILKSLKLFNYLFKHGLTWMLETHSTFSGQSTWTILSTCFSRCPVR